MTAHLHLLADTGAAPAAPLVLALQALDARLSREFRRVQARGAISDDELRGLYASAGRVERLLAHSVDDAPPEDALEQGSLSDALMVLPAWRALARDLAPTPIERDLVLLALARELRLGYETVFGYLNDDLTRRAPTRDLALRLLARDDDGHVRLRAAFGESAPLVRHGVLRLGDAGNASWLAAGVGVTPLAAALLGDAGTCEARLPGGVSVTRRPRAVDVGDVPAAAQARLARIACAALDDLSVPVIVLQGRPGCGRAELALDLAHSLGRTLLRVDLRVSLRAAGLGTGTASLVATSDLPQQALEAALLWQRLAGAVVLVDAIETCLVAGEGGARLPAAIADALERARGPVLLRVDDTTRCTNALEGLRFAHVDVASAGVVERSRHWLAALRREAPLASLSEPDALGLADRFDLAPGAIQRAVRRAADEGALDAARDSPASVARLSEAARTASRDSLGTLATQAPTSHVRDDLVLPAPSMRRLADLQAAIRDRAIVLDRWGFGRRATRARGISALFAGASGTGKTMAAGVIARELGLDLFVIDLSGIVSKYIGETEKNLDNVFRVARNAGAILFFDEADALFGKRSEVKDAHDRYSNIEVAYLLQKLDAHDGIVILATNLSRNLDAAFSRRIRYVVEFAQPCEADRLRLWRGIFPAQAPLDTDVDLGFLAAGFPLAGGDIRNVALEAAHLAVAERPDGTIAMRHLVRAMGRQVVKQGKTPSAAEFRQFVALLDRDG